MHFVSIEVIKLLFAIGVHEYNILQPSCKRLNMFFRFHFITWVDCSCYIRSVTTGNRFLSGSHSRLKQVYDISKKVKLENMRSDLFYLL